MTDHSMDGAGCRVCLVLWSGRTGGAETFTAGLAAALRTLGADARVLFITSPTPLAETLDEQRVPWSSLSLRAGREVLLHPRSLGSAVNALGDSAIFVSSGYLAAAARIGGFRGRLLAVEHGSLLQMPARNRVQRVVRQLDRMSGLRFVDVEVAVSEYVRSTVLRGRHARHVIVIHNAIDADVFTPTRAATRRVGELTVGMAGRLIPGKGFDTAIDALAPLAAKNDITVKVAGGGPARPALEECVARHGVGERFQFVDWVSHMPSFWRECDVAIVPSTTWVESFGMVAVEAMACGTPVVASSNGALPEVVIDGVTGTLVPPGDVLELRRAVEAYLHDPELRRKQGAAGRERAVSEFSFAACAARYLEALKCR